jgi:hypothetical protein
MDIQWKEVFVKFSELAKYYHDKFDTPITGQFFEELWNKGLKSCGYGTDWSPGSHRPGVDIYINDHKTVLLGKPIGLSLKGHKYNKKYLNISGCRTTKHNTLTEKLDHIGKLEANYQHVIYCECDVECSRPKLYNIYTINSSYLSVDKFKWKEVFYVRGKNRGLPKGYETDTINGVRMKIQGQMSDQLWVSIDRKGMSQEDVKILGTVTI